MASVRFPAGAARAAHSAAAPRLSTAPAVQASKPSPSTSPAAKEKAFPQASETALLALATSCFTTAAGAVVAVVVAHGAGAEGAGAVAESGGAAGSILASALE